MERVEEMMDERVEEMMEEIEEKDRGEDGG